jgi:polyisoprenoid-binding protein YceI
VQTGQIAITVQQMGSAVEGQFQDWTAEIAYDPDAGGPVKGHATVTISIPSLTLGTVSDQAMGPDYFDAEAYQTAVFDADLLQTETGHEAQGTLTIKGTSVLATLPFDLQITGDTATASGTMTVDRRAFAIGDGMTDEANLGFNVQITVALTATR